MLPESLIFKLLQLVSVSQVAAMMISSSNIPIPISPVNVNNCNTSLDGMTIISPISSLSPLSTCSQLTSAMSISGCPSPCLSTSSSLSSSTYDPLETIWPKEIDEFSDLALQACHQEVKRASDSLGISTVFRSFSFNPVMTAIPIHLSYTEETLSQVRTKLQDKLSNKRCEIDAALLDRLMNDDLLLRRYIKRRNGDPESSVTFLCSVLEWRKRMGFPDLTETSFPSEFYEVGGIYNYGVDNQGNPVVHIRIRLFQKIDGILDILKKFSIYQMYRADELAASKGPEYGWVLVFDCTDASIANADIDMANFVSSTLRNYFPSGQKYILVHRLPWLLSAVKTLVYTMLPGYVKKKIRFCDEKTITDHIELNNLPDYLGGPGDPSDYRLIPEGLSATQVLTTKGLLPMSEDQLIKTNEYYERLRSFLYPVIQLQKESKQTKE